MAAVATVVGGAARGNQGGDGLATNLGQVAQLREILENKRILEDKEVTAMLGRHDRSSLLEKRQKLLAKVPKKLKPFCYALKRNFQNVLPAYEDVLKRLMHRLRVICRALDDRKLPRRRSTFRTAGQIAENDERAQWIQDITAFLDHYNMALDPVLLPATPAPMTPRPRSAVAASPSVHLKVTTDSNPSTPYHSNSSHQTRTASSHDFHSTHATFPYSPPLSKEMLQAHHARSQSEQPRGIAVPGGPYHSHADYSSSSRGVANGVTPGQYHSANGAIAGPYDASRSRSPPRARGGQNKANNGMPPEVDPRIIRALNSVSNGTHHRSASSPPPRSGPRSPRRRGNGIISPRKGAGQRRNYGNAGSYSGAGPSSSSGDQHHLTSTSGPGPIHVDRHVSQQQLDRRLARNQRNTASSSVSDIAPLPMSSLNGMGTPKASMPARSPRPSSEMRRVDKADVAPGINPDGTRRSRYPET